VELSGLRSFFRRPLERKIDQYVGWKCLTAFHRNPKNTGIRWVAKRRQPNLRGYHNRPAGMTVAATVINRRAKYDAKKKAATATLLSGLLTNRDPRNFMVYRR